MSNEFRAIRGNSSFAEVVEDRWYGTPALKVRGKGFARLKEDGRMVMFLLDSVDEQEFLIEARPKVYFITDHYRGHPSVLARLTALRPSECRLRLRRAWRLKAPKALLKDSSRNAQICGKRSSESESFIARTR